MIYVLFFLLGFSYTSKVFSEEEIYMRVIQNGNGSDIVKVYTPSTLDKLYIEIYNKNSDLIAGIHQDYYVIEKFNGRKKNTYVINIDYIEDRKGVTLVLFPGTEREDLYNLSDIEIINSGEKIENKIMSVNGAIKVMSYNIHHGKNKLGMYTLDQMIDTIKENEIDIVGLQEVDRNVYRSKFKDQVKLMASELKMYYAFGPNISVMGMEYGNAILSKYPIRSTENVHLPGFKEKRGLLISKIDVKGSDVNFLVTHLGLTKQERVNQLKVISRYIEHIGENSILVGDFNSDYNSDEMNSIKAVMNDSSKEQEGQFKSTYEGLVIKSKIDYIFVSPNIKVLNYDVLDTNASDHFPVIADLEF